MYRKSVKTEDYKRTVRNRGFVRCFHAVERMDDTVFYRFLFWD